MNAPPGFASVRAPLRAATHDIHQALHRAAPFAAIAEGRATLESYGATLMFLYRFHVAVSPWCACGAQALGAPQLADAHVRCVVIDCRHERVDLPRYILRRSSAGRNEAWVSTRIVHPRVLKTHAG